ncbi:hypothetical protein TRIP_D170047 [uncultured Paludibacter sp.]|nr:hypothetical protein TRIP_D170047 [uncultured Paludibacter sp.]
MSAKEYVHKYFSTRLIINSHFSLTLTNQKTQYHGNIFNNGTAFENLLVYSYSSHSYLFDTNCDDIYWSKFDGWY